MLEHFDNIYEALKKEVLPESANKEVKDAALSVISSVVRKFRDDQPSHDLVLNKIFSTSIGTLLNRDSKLFRPTLEIALSCANASDNSFAYVIGKVLPITLTDLTSNEEVTEAELVEVLQDLRNFLLIGSAKNVLSSYANDVYVIQVQKELVKIITTSSSPDLLKVTWLVLESLSNIITDENRQTVYKELNNELTTSTAEQAKCLLALAQEHPTEVYKLVLESYIDRSFTEPEEARKIFTTLATLLCVHDLRNHIIEVFCLNLFNNNLKEIQLVALEVLDTILKSPDSHEIAKTLNTEWRIVVKLIDLIKNESPDNAEDVMYYASLVMNLVVRTLPNDEQMALVEKYLPLMKINESISDLYVVSGLLGFLDAAIPLESHFEYLVNELTTLSLNSPNESTRLLANRLLCSMFNRAPIDDNHKKILRKIFEIVKHEVKKGSHAAVITLGWISKGLLARGHPDAAEILETLSELLDHPKLSKAAVLAFEIISLECPQLHLPLLKHLFKQKIFMLAMKFFEHKIEKFSEHHLTAMAHILQITPHLALRMHIDKVGPILFKCIKTDDNEESGGHSKRILICLKIINNFILEKHQYILTHLQHLVADILKLSAYKPSIDIRVMACKSIENLINYPLFTLVPYKNEVTHDLTTAIDDHKRLVRAAAVSARLAWFQLGEGEGPAASN